jgi:apolipoprotein N-acyltransferase
LADAKGNRSSERKKLPIWAAILIFIGAFALLANLNIIPDLNWDLFWPILLIAVGVWGFYEYYYGNSITSFNSS